MAIPIPDPGFDQSADELRVRMFSNMDSGLDQAEGSLIWNLTQPLAIELAQVYAAMNLVVEFGFLQESYGQFLDARAEEHGVTRKPASKATGEVTFSGTNGTVIPAGTLVSTTVAPGSTGPSVSFVTTEVGTIAAGTAVVGIEAVDPGLEGNVPAGAITRLSGLITGVSGVTNAAATTGGADLESDDDLRQRVIDAVTAFNGAGTADDYRIWALEVEGVGSASVEPLWNGAGTVRVLVMDADGNPAGAPLITEVEAYIDERKPIGADVTVIAPTVEAVDVVATLVMEAGFTVVGVTDAVEERLAAYFDGLVPGDDVIRNEVGAVIVTTPGVADYTTLTLDAAATNKAITATQIAQLGTVTLS